MKKQIIFMALLFMVIAVEKGKAAKKLDIVTTLPSLASLTESIGGDLVKVYSITRGVQDAHYVEAKPSYMLKLNKADLLIYSGLELEIGWLPLLIQGARNQKVVVGARGNLNASLALPEQGILEKPRGEVDRSMGDVHPAGNPHYLLNPHHGLEITQLIADKLIELDPDHQSEYENNLETFRKELLEKIKQWETQAKVLNGLKVVCYHVHWSYLLDWMGIQQAGYIELRPGIPPTPRHKREIIELIKQHGIKLVIVSSWKDPKKSKEVADETGAELVILPGEVDAMDGAEDYFLWINYLVSQLVKACNSYKEKSD